MTVSPVLLAAMGAFLFSLNGILIRRGVLRVADASVGALISVPLSVVFFFVILAFMGDLGSITNFSWQGYAWLVAAGIAHFVIGRSFNYRLIKMVGANMASVINRFSPLTSVFLGITILGEVFSWRLALGVLLTVGGLFVTTINSKGNDLKKISALTRKAWLMGALVGVSWGVSPILIKIGLGDSGAPITGAFISYAGATAVLSGSLLNENGRSGIASTKGLALLFFIIAGLCSATAQLLRYMALDIGAASVVQPVFSLNPLFLIILSFLFNRKIEAFGLPVVLGLLMAGTGTFLLA